MQVVENPRRFGVQNLDQDRGFGNVGFCVDSSVRIDVRTVFFLHLRY